MSQFLSLGFAVVMMVLTTTTVQATQIVDLSKDQIAAANSAVMFPRVTDVIRSCPKEVAAMAKMGAMIVSGNYLGSPFGVQYSFSFAKEDKSANLTIRVTMKNRDGSAIVPPKVDCYLSDTSGQ